MNTYTGEERGASEQQLTFTGTEGGSARFIVGASGILSTPIDALRTMLANSTSFQAWTNKTNTTDALTHIFIVAPDASGDYPDPVEHMPRPFALINLDTARRSLRGSGNSPLFAPNNELLLKFEAKNHGYHKLATDPAFIFLNAVGAIISDLEGESQGDGGLQILALQIESPERKKQSYTGEPGDFYAIEIKITAGFR
jgi:hypothetical protein